MYLRSSVRSSIYQTSEDAFYACLHINIANAGEWGAKKKGFVNEDYMQLFRKFHVLV